MVVHSPSKPTATPWPALLPMGALAGKPPIPIARPATLVGSRQTANLRLHSSQVSKAHALILSSDSKVYIRDLNSRTKVLVNGNEVRDAELKEGDVIEIGGTDGRYVAAEGAAAAAPAPVALSSEMVAAEPATLPPPDADLDELLALESLAEAPQPPKPSGESKVFAPGSAPEDSNAPIPLEDELRLPEPRQVPAVSAKPEPAAPSEAQPQPQIAQKSEDDVAAEKAAEDELMALVNEELIEATPEVKEEVQPQAEPEPQPIAEQPEPAEESPEVEEEETT